jgi:dihydrofolate reductase
MSIVSSSMSVSLDGFVTGPGDSRENPWGGRGAEVLHHWLLEGRTDEDHTVLQEMVDGVGAVIMGRTSFDKNEGDGGWGDGGPVGDTPCFVVTHRPPTKPVPPVYTFVNDGVESAIRLAKAVAGDKVVALHGATMPQQALELGLLDEIQIHLIPVLLGGGTRLFDVLSGPVRLERNRVVTTPWATHIRFTVVR